MTSFVDCPHCGSEFIVDETIMSSNLRCPDCLQWVNTFNDVSPKSLAASYAYGYDDGFEDYGYQAGYDY